MIINIYEPRDNWILQNIIDAFKKHADESIIIRSIYYKDKKIYPDGINFFCNMGIYYVYLQKNNVKPSIRDVVRTTHIERWKPWNILYKRPYYMPITQIAHSQMWYDWFVEMGIHPVAVAIPGVDDDFFKITQKPIKKDKYTVALVGGIKRSGRKGEKWLKPLMSATGTKFKWLFIGRGWDPILKAHFYNQFDITYHTNYSAHEYYEFFEDIDIYLSLSTIEGGPMPLLESMAAGVVPVVSDTGFARDLITHNKNGFIYPVGNIKELVGILNALSNQNLDQYRSLAKEAAKPYTWKNFVSVIMKVMVDVEKKMKNEEYF